MATLDIRTLTSQGITPWNSEEIPYPENPRNALYYKVKFMNFKYDPEAEELMAQFRVTRSILQNGDFQQETPYVKNSVARKSTMVDFYGNRVDPEIDGQPNPAVWGNEFERMKIIFNAPISDSLVVESYQQDLFDKGFFDFPG